ncbi:MAG: amino-acid N-acetyltransferase [Verrucomicrobiota bacterium]
MSGQGQERPFGDLRGMLQYVPQFRGRTFVIAVDSDLLGDAVVFANIVLDLATLRLLDIDVVLVHGMGHQMRALAKRRGVELSDEVGTGVTDAKTLEVGIDASSRLGSALLQQLTTSKIRAATTNALIGCRVGVVSGVDHEHTGRLERMDDSSLKMLLDDGIMPVIPPIAFDGRGNTLRLDKDQVAMEIAAQLGADKLIYLVAGEGSLRDGSPGMHQLAVSEAKDYVARTQLESRLMGKFEGAIMACEAGVPRGHIVSGNLTDAPLLEELFSNEGIGTMVFADSYHKIRSAKEEDIEEMMSMMRPAVAKDRLLFRSPEEVMGKLEDYYVIEIDGNVVGSVAIHHYEAERAAELACLFVKKSHENQGYGRDLVQFAEEVARERGADSMIVMSTQAYEFFSRLPGYAFGEVSLLPKERRSRYESSERRSKILVKSLQDLSVED